MHRELIQLDINGERRELAVPPQKVLLDVLREDLGRAARAPVGEDVAALPIDERGRRQTVRDGERLSRMHDDDLREGREEGSGPRLQAPVNRFDA